MADDRDQHEPRRADSRGLPLAERPRSWLVTDATGVRRLVARQPEAPLSMLAGYVDAELVLAGQRAPVDSLEAELAPPRSERRG